MARPQKLTPFLWFEDQAEEAANFYATLFDDSKILHVSRYGEGAPGPKGTAMVVDLQLAGLRLQLLNGGPHFTLNEAFSLMVHCDSQAEVDRLWEKLTANGGEEGRCGWVKDRFGLSWQLVPEAFGRLISDPDPVKSQRVMQAMLKMSKLDVAELERAHRG